MINRETLRSLPAAVRGPDYDIRRISPGIVHFGVGNFFRAHEALYVDAAMASSGATDWGIVGVGLSGGARSEAKARSFREQDCLYSLTETAPSGEASVRIVGALCEYLLAPGSEDAVLDRLSSPKTRIVSMTITEGGYNIDETSGAFRLDTNDIRHDLAHPDCPRTIFGFVVEALRRRRDAGDAAFTILSCDNLRHNGDVARRAFLGFARARDAALADWIEENATFPNSMVDRITPTVSPDIACALNAASGLDDALPLVAEDFHAWVLEDRFAAGRPALEAAGARFVDDVTPYEHAKVRILNASHILLAFGGLLLDRAHIHEALAVPELRALSEAYLERDVLPRIEAPDGLDLAAFRDQTMARFSNAAMADQTLRIGSDGCSKIQVFWTETVRRALASDAPDVSRLALGIAIYLEVLRGRTESGADVSLSEPAYSEAQWACAHDEDMARALALPAFDAWRDCGTKALDAEVIAMRGRLREHGLRRTVQDVLAQAS